MSKWLHFSFFEAIACLRPRATWVKGNILSSLRNPWAFPLSFPGVEVLQLYSEAFLDPFLDILLLPHGGKA